MLDIYERTVVLVEADTALRRLISLGLQSRGLQVIESPSLKHLSLLNIKTPHLLIHDVDSGIGSRWSDLASLREDPRFTDLPIVVLSWGENRPYLSEKMTIVSKPFDARNLHTTVDHLMSTYPQAGRLLPVVHLAAPEIVIGSPSIWPLITAAALMLAIIGMLIHPALFVLGLALGFVALLWWTLGTTHQRSNELAPA